MADRAPPKTKQEPSFTVEQLIALQKEKHVPIIPQVNMAAVGAALPAGNYECKITGWKYNEASKNSGQPTVTMQYNSDEHGTIFRTYSMQPQALFGLKRDLMRIGADPEEMNSETCDLEGVLNQVIGYGCTLKVGEPRVEQDKNGDPTGRVFTNPLEVIDPGAVLV